MDLNTYLKDLEYLVNIDSGWDCPEGQTAIANFFAERFHAMGWQTQLHPLGAHCGPCLVCCNRLAAHYDVMLIGHIDTVFPKGTAAARPFRRDETRAYGPGVLDMKQGSLLIFYILQALPHHMTDRLNILAVFNPDEEIQSPYSCPLTAALAAKTDYALIYEGASKDGAHCIQRKGRLTLHIAFTGKACHCGYVFEQDARSAISEMARWIVALDGLQNREHNTSVNVGVVSGGIGINTVAQDAAMQVDIRFTQNSQIALVDETIDQLTRQAQRRGIGVTILARTITPALEPTPAGEAYLQRVQQLAQQIGQTFVCRLRGGLSDANHLQNCICIDALGPGGDHDHTEREYLNLDSIVPAFDLSYAILQDLAQQKHPEPNT